MRKVLFVGDVHATPDELEDCRALFSYVRDVANLRQVDEVCLLGDSYHTFNVMRVEVLAFWCETFAAMKHKTSALVGNHDFAGEGSPLHSMMAHDKQITVIDRPAVRAGVLYMPYFSDREAFVRDARALGRKTLICHQTFAGSKYENGFYAEDGVNPDDFTQEKIFSGHIHAPQEFGRVKYLGAPRWRTLTDANTDRGIWVLTFDDEGCVVEQERFDTGEICRQIRYVIDTPDEPFSGEIDPKHDWRIDVKGPPEYVEARKSAFAGAKLRLFPERSSTPRVRESDGIDTAFKKYMGVYVPRFGTPTDVLGDMVRSRLGF